MYPFLKAADHQASCVTVHSYPLAIQPNQPLPTPEQSLAVTNDDFFKRWSKIYNTMAEPKSRLILGETQSVTDGGATKVSNTFVSALWSLDHMATSAWSGFSGAQFHGGLVTSTHSFNNDVGDYYTYSVLEVNDKNRTMVDVRPIYYGLLAFNRMLDWVSDFNATTDIVVDRGSMSGEPENGLKTWMFSAVNGNGAIMVINKNSTDRFVSITSPAKIIDNGVAVAESLIAPSIQAFNGIKLAGQTFDSTCDGRPSGKYNPNMVSKSKNGTYNLNVPAYSAMILFLGPNTNSSISGREESLLPNICH